MILAVTVGDVADVDPSSLRNGVTMARRSSSGSRSLLNDALIITVMNGNNKSSSSYRKNMGTGSSEQDLIATAMMVHSAYRPKQVEMIKL